MNNQSAFLFALVAHSKAGNVRKYTGEQYMVHPASVVDILKRHGVENKTIIDAAFLHDTVEDAGVSIQEIQRIFGDGVAILVHELTNPAKREDGNRAARFKINLVHLAKASPAAQTIKCADILDNTPSICHHDPDFARVYLSEKLMQLGLLRRALPSLYAEARDCVLQNADRLGIK